MHTETAIEYGTKMVGFTNPKKKGTHMDLPIFKNCLEAKKVTGCDGSVIYVPALFAKDAILDALEAEIELIVAITEGIP